MDCRIRCETCHVFGHIFGTKAQNNHSPSPFIWELKRLNSVIPCMRVACVALCAAALIADYSPAGRASLVDQVNDVGTE